MTDRAERATAEGRNGDARALPRAGSAALAVPRLAALGGIAAACAFLLVRLVPDVRGKPLFEDEAVAGLIAARPLPEVLETVLWERGGGPLHFLLAHLTLAVEPSAFALRWLSVVFALATIPLCYDLGRRLAGPLAGTTAAIVAATSSMLAVYGSFARMYSLYAFAAALAIDLFVRAVDERTPRAALAAAAAAWLLPAVHPYGAFVVAAEAAVALALWRGRPLLPALPVFAIGVAMVPFAVADLRLADRFAVGLEGETRVADPADAWDQVVRSLAASAGGDGWMALAGLGLALAGLAAVARRKPAFTALAVLALGVPPVLLVLVRTGSAPGLSPRHFIFALPLAAALIGVAVARGLRDLGPKTRVAVIAALALAAALAPVGGIRDPRDWSNDVLGGGPPSRALGSAENLAAPTAWLRRNVGAGDVVFPYSPVFLAGLTATKDAHALPYAQRTLLLRAMDRVEPPVRRLVVAVPLGDTPVDLSRLRTLLGPRFEPHAFPAWLLVEGKGPLADDHTVLLATYHALAAARESTEGTRQYELSWYFKVTLSTLCGSLRTYGERCPPRLPGAPNPRGLPVPRASLARE